MIEHFFVNKQLLCLIYAWSLRIPEEICFRMADLVKEFHREIKSDDKFLLFLRN